MYSGDQRCEVVEIEVFEKGKCIKVKVRRYLI